MDENIVPRIGNFLWMLGVALIALFIASGIDHDIQILYLAFGAPSIFLAILFRRKADPKPSSERFSWIRKILTGIKKED